MKNKKAIKISALAAGSLLVGAFSANATETQSFEDLGTGSELRSELLSNLNPVQFFKNTEVELTCGEGKCGDKAKDAEKAKDAKTEKPADKAGEHKCGEGKCGEKAKDEKKEAAPAKEAGDKAKEDKAGEHKCGEGKCGN
jgi:uncharacterized low-complexity protein